MPPANKVLNAGKIPTIMPASNDIGQGCVHGSRAFGAKAI